jgi:hypothetical protein
MANRMTIAPDDIHTRLAQAIDPGPITFRAPPPRHGSTRYRPRRKRSQKKDNFDILSLVTEAAVPVLDEGNLAFREGIVDVRTEQLKTGGRKFKVGKIAHSAIWT